MPKVARIHTSMKFGNATKIGISWAAIVVAGLYGFYLSKSSVIAKRVEHMKTRERIYASNSGEYEPSTRKYAN